jgi:Tfp pilus assembly protein PilF
MVEWVGFPVSLILRLGGLTLVVSLAVLIWPWLRVSRFVVTRTLRAPRRAVWDALVGIGEVRGDGRVRPPLVPAHLISRKKISDDPEIWENVYDKRGGDGPAFSVERRRVLKRDEPRHLVSRLERANGDQQPLGEDSFSDYLFDETVEGTRVTFTRQMQTTSLGHYIFVGRHHAKALDKAAAFFGTVDVAPTSGKPLWRMMLRPLLQRWAIPENQRTAIFDGRSALLIGGGISVVLCLTLSTIYFFFGAPHFDHAKASTITLILAGVGLLTINVWIKGAMTAPSTEPRHCEHCALDSQITGLTAAIESGHETPETLPGIYRERGKAYQQQDEFDRAIDDFNQAIRLDPTNADAFACRGTAYSYKDDLDRAILDYDEAIRLAPQDAVYYHVRAWLHHGQGDYDRAIADFDQAIQMDPTDAASFASRGYAHVGKRDFDRAIADYDEAIRLDAENALGYFHRANAYRGKGELDRAIADYGVAIGLDANNPTTYCERAGTYRQIGDLDRADADYRAALALGVDEEMKSRIDGALYELYPTP